MGDREGEKERREREGRYKGMEWILRGGRERERERERKGEREEGREGRGHKGMDFKDEEQRGAAEE